MHYLAQVTRKIIRKCVSADGAEHEETTLEGAPQGFVPAAEGDGYSKVVKRTVVKSEGDHTEVCSLQMSFFIVFCSVLFWGCFFVLFFTKQMEGVTSILTLIYKVQLNKLFDLGDFYRT